MPKFAKFLLAASLLISAGPILGAPPAASPPSYHSEPSIPAADGRWDLGSFDAARRRLLIARGDTVTVQGGDKTSHGNAGGLLSVAA